MKRFFSNPDQAQTENAARFSLSPWFQKAQFAFYFALLAVSLIAGFSQIDSKQFARDEKSIALEKALYTRAEFFGAQAIVPYPTERARENLRQVLQKFPDDAEALSKLSEINERLGHYEEAEANLKAVRPENLAALAAFYERRAEFGKQAAVLEKILVNSSGDRRATAFADLILVARRHELGEYLAPAFYQKIIDQSEGSWTVFERYVEKLIEERNYSEASKSLDAARAKFPAAKAFLLKKQIEILTAEGKPEEAERVYRAAFDPLWSEEESREFFDFLSEHDRLRAYESELKTNFSKNPADFQIAVRLIHLARGDDEQIGKIVSRIEAARAAAKVKWQPDELLIVSHFLIRAGDGATASRFLYTLCADFKPEKQSERRRRTLYQLFEILSDAGDESLPLAKGDLKFYESVARADLNPGITTGILSLIFSDAAPRREFDRKQRTAIKLFNRAAAFRVFQEFKTEYPDAPELAQMYLDVVRFYTKKGKLGVAEQTLAEFERKFTDFKNFPDAALKLADAFIAVKNFEKERQIYQKLLDFLGKSEQAKFPFASADADVKDLTQIKPPIAAYPPRSNDGIAVENDDRKNDYYYYRSNNYKNHLTREAAQISYADVLARYVAALARENKTQEILNLYADESAKYPDEAQLYEQMLQWLGQTNLVEKQLEIYQRALRKFPERNWQERFARWLIRQKREREFADYSRGLIETFDDLKTQAYLRNFIDGKEYSNAAADGQLYFALYSLAHERFPRNTAFTKGLLRYFKKNNQETEYQNLLAENYFESTELRREFLENLAKKGQMREFLAKAELRAPDAGKIESLPYQLFRADAHVWLSEFEKAVEFFRTLETLYPFDADFSENYLSLARSFGQQDRRFLNAAADYSNRQTEAFPANAANLTRAGEIQAELGDYAKAREHWRKIISLGAGEPENYLDAATVFWDYFQFDDALETISNLRAKYKNENLYAFQAGAVYEGKRQTAAAVGEYLKALEEDTGEARKAKNRLQEIHARSNFSAVIRAAFEKQRTTAKNSFRLVFNYADLLYRLERSDEAIELLKLHVKQEKSKDNLLETKRFFRDLDNPPAVRFALARLIENSRGERETISYQLQMAENFRAAGEKENAARAIDELTRQFPSNYGVLTEAENFYWEIGKRESSLAVLRAARTRARGEYAYQFSRKLAQRLDALNRTGEAEAVLLALHRENANDEEVFESLSRIFVRRRDADSLRRIFAETFAALENQDLEPREFEWRAQTLRKKMIAALTVLKDYQAAAAEYIELINRNPGDEALLKEAVNFVKRYGGAENLLAYYRKTAAESFKNYRWNVVLARIYEANGDLPKAAENYRAAIYNQPAMLELYEALNEIYLKSQNREAALENIEKMLELSNGDPKYVKQKIKLLESLGRTADAAAEKLKLPVEDSPQPKTLSERFAEAQSLRQSESDAAVEKYRAAFAELLADPAQNALKAADISNFVQTVHERETLPEIFGKLWNLREKLIVVIETKDALNSGKARDNLQILDGAMTDALSSELKKSATGNEFLDLRKEFENRLNLNGTDKNNTLALLDDLIARCGFEDLRESVLIKRLDGGAAAEARDQNLRLAVKFYDERGNYRRVLELLENQPVENNLEFLKIYAEKARLLGETAKEISALRSIYFKQKQDDPSTLRFLQLLTQNNRAELERLAADPRLHQLQLINFLLAADEFELARTAIRNSAFSSAWKFSRAAEMSLKFEKFSADDEADFIKALGLAPIGELTRRKPDDGLPLIGKDWFNLAEKYGKWFYAAGRTESAEEYLPALVELRPKDAKLQARVGYFYLAQKDHARALEHFTLAAELNPNDQTVLPYLGAAYFQTGEKEKAFQTWLAIIDGDSVSLSDAELYLKTLADFGQSAKARADLTDFVKARLDDEEDPENIVSLLREISASFADENERTAYFKTLCEELADNRNLPATVIENSLVAEKNSGVFYEFLIARSDNFGDYEHDYDFVSILETSWDAREAELLLDADADFEIEEPESERLAWQKKYLEFALKQKNHAAAARLIAEIETSLKGHFARPVWLRLAEIRLLAATGQTTQSLAAAKKFTGVELSPNARKTVPPDLERFNQTLAALADENRQNLILPLREAFYARRLALGEFDAVNFSALAKTEFEKGETASARRILSLMAEITLPERRAELAALPVINRFAEKDEQIPEAPIAVDTNEFLIRAAETATELGFFEEAVLFREKLRAAEPFDWSNRLETARLRARTDSPEEAAKSLFEIIRDQKAHRRARWQALLILAEIAGESADSWRQIKTENQNAAEPDAEMRAAIEAFEFFQTNRPDDALKLLEKNDFTPDLKFIRAVFSRRRGAPDEALRLFSEILIFSDEIELTFGFWEAAPALQMTELYLATGKPGAALAMAKNGGKFDSSPPIEPDENRETSLRLLPHRAALIARETKLRLLELLANAAALGDDYAAAIEFETARLDSLENSSERQNAQSRLDDFRQKAREQENRARNSLVFDEKTVSAF